jgi:delta-aminolevulinic acid dehydratase/porphobilinogen synthase
VIGKAVFRGQFSTPRARITEDRLEERAVLEAFTDVKRAGADIISYHAPEVVR